MGLFTKGKLGCRYDLLDYEVRTWHIDRGDYHADKEISLGKAFTKKHQRFATVEERKEFCGAEGIIEEECEIGRNFEDSNPNLRITIHENREWNPISKDWIPDGRLVLDFLWPWDSEFKWKDDQRQGCLTAEDLKKLADFIYDFLKDYNVWGSNSVTQTKVNKKYNFESQYLFNYYVNDEKKNSEKINFNVTIKKYECGIEGFEAFDVVIPDFLKSEQIDQFVDIVMTPLQLREFADFIHKSLGKDLIDRINSEKQFLI